MNEYHIGHIPTVETYREVARGRVLALYKAMASLQQHGLDQEAETLRPAVDLHKSWFEYYSRRAPDGAP